MEAQHPMMAYRMYIETQRARLLCNKLIRMLAEGNMAAVCNKSSGTRVYK